MHNLICSQCNRSHDISHTFIVKWSFDKNRWMGQKNDYILRKILGSADKQRYYHRVPIINLIDNTKIGETICGPLVKKTVFQEIADILKRSRKRF